MLFLTIGSILFCRHRNPFLTSTPPNGPPCLVTQSISIRLTTTLLAMFRRISRPMSLHFKSTTMTGRLVPIRPPLFLRLDHHRLFLYHRRLLSPPSLRLSRLLPNLRSHSSPNLLSRGRILLRGRLFLLVLPQLVVPFLIRLWLLHRDLLLRGRVSLFHLHHHPHLPCNESLLDWLATTHLVHKKPTPSLEQEHVKHPKRMATQPPSTLTPSRKISPFSHILCGTIHPTCWIKLPKPMPQIPLPMGSS